MLYDVSVMYNIFSHFCELWVLWLFFVGNIVLLVCHIVDTLVSTIGLPPFKMAAATFDLS